MKIDRILLQLLGVLLPCGVAVAHSGHGDPRWSSSMVHFLIEPEHAIPIAFAGAVGLVLGALFANRSVRAQTVESRRTIRRVRSRR